MNWDPNTAIIVYQPLDVYSIASKNVLSLIENTENVLTKYENELSQYKPRGIGFIGNRKVTVLISGCKGNRDRIDIETTHKVLQSLEAIESFIFMIWKDFNLFTKGFERSFTHRINSVNGRIVKLISLCKFYKERHFEIGSSQLKFYS